jgi:hypothetical protein
MKRIIIATLALWLVSVSCCSLLEMGDSRREIVGGYCFFSGSSISLTGITRCDDDNYTHIISPQIIGTDWNEDFIVVKRDTDNLTDIPDDIEWYIIDVSAQTVYGPYQYDEYVQKRNELSVPSKLELLSP